MANEQVVNENVRLHSVPSDLLADDISASPATLSASRQRPIRADRVLRASGEELLPEFGDITSAFFDTLTEYLPARDSSAGWVLEQLTDVYSWSDSMSDTTVSHEALRARAEATGVFIGKSAVAGLGAYGTVELGLLGGALGGPAGLAGGVALGAGATLLGTEIAERAVRGGFRFIDDVLDGIRSAFRR